MYFQNRVTKHRVTKQLYYAILYSRYYQMYVIFEIKVEDRHMKKYKCVEFTQSHCDSVGKILSKFNAFIFFAVLVYICKP